MIGQGTNHLWQSTLFAVAAALVTLVFRKNRAQVRYCLWLSASVKFLVPFALLTSLGNSLWSALAARKIATEFAPPAVSLTMDQITQPFPDTFSFVPSAPLTHTNDWISIAILGVWVCGFVGVVLVRFRGWLQIRAAMRASTPIDTRASVAVRSLPGLLEPGVVGFLRPILLLPEDILKRLPPSQLEAVLAHELSHIRRRDNLTAAIHMVVEAVFWFHPLVWWIGARLIEERERACDEAVLSLGGEPGDYAEAILRVCKLYVESPLACAPGISGADLKKRIVRIMTQRLGYKLSFGRKLLLASIGLAVLAGPVLLGLLNATQVRAQSSMLDWVHMRKVQAQAKTDNSTQGIASTWQGTLHSGKDRRVVFKITKVSGDAYKADFFDLDQGGEPIRVSSVTSDRTTVKVNLAVIGVAYTGTLSSEGNSITGTWNQGSAQLPLELTRATPATEWQLPATRPMLPMMAANASPTLEVATIKPSKPEATNTFFRYGPRLQVANTNLNDLIVFAYGAHPKQVVGAPTWTETEKFDIEAKPNAEGLPTLDQWRMMMRQLLAERYKLTFHREQKVLPVYLLTVSEAGPRLTKSGGDPNGRPGLGFRGRVGGDVSAYNATIGDFINFMTRYVRLDRPIIDRTGIAGRYDFTLNWTPDDSQFGGKSNAPADGADTLPSLYTAIQEQLGLKLDATKAPAEVMVIDHVERPSEN